MSIAIARLGDLRCKVGEGPVWDEQEGLLYFVDIRGQRLQRYDPVTGSFEGWDMPSTIGSLAVRRDGGVVVALANGFYGFDFIGAPTLLARPDGDKTTFNDGKTDRQGRFVAGTASGFVDPAPRGSLYSLNGDHTLKRIATGLAITNGPCWSPDGRTLYCTDSRSQTISAWDYDPETGDLAGQRGIFHTGAAFDTASDGATVDAEGGIWITLVQGGKIARIWPDGTIDRVIETPVPWPSSVMFGGPDLDRLFFTSIDGTVYDMPSSPESGGLFVIDGLGIRGIAEQRFAG